VLASTESLAFKAAVINAIVATRGVQSVIECGCGDGNQLMLVVRYPTTPDTT